jgi:ABC-2 type transport system ATP-binding protein
VGLADALLSEPPALLLDEPFGGLDPLQRHEFRTIIRELAQSGIAVLFSSHVLPEVEELADRVLILHQGVARALGTQDELAGQLQRCTSYRIKINAPSTSFEEDLRNEFPGIAVKALSESVWELEALEESSRSALFSWLANRQEATLEFSPVLPRLEDLFRSTVS